MTMERLAKAMGVERHTISRYEAGVFTPNAGHLRGMAHTLNFPQALLLRL
jgi:transcriptional regulator with XRE-family HTH domain